MALGVQQTYGLGTLLAIAIPLGSALLVAILALIFVALRAVCVASRERKISREVKEERYRLPDVRSSFVEGTEKRDRRGSDCSSIPTQPKPVARANRRSLPHLKTMAPSTVMSVANKESGDLDKHGEKSQSQNDKPALNAKGEDFLVDMSKSLGSPLGSAPIPLPSTAPPGSNQIHSNSRDFAGQNSLPTYPSPPPKSLSRISTEGLSKHNRRSPDEGNWRVSLAPTIKGGHEPLSKAGSVPADTKPSPLAAGSPQSIKHQYDVSDSGTDLERTKLYDMLRHKGDLREAPGPRSLQAHKGHTSIASYAGSVISGYTRSNGLLTAVTESGGESFPSIVPTPTEKKSSTNALPPDLTGIESSGLFSHRSSSSRSSSLTSSYGTAMASQSNGRNVSAGTNNSNSRRVRRISAEAYGPTFSKQSTAASMQINKPLPLTPSPKPGATSSPLTTPQGLEHGVLRNLGGSLHRVIFPYRPQLSDELELRPNSIIKVYQLFDDGWCVGVFDDNGKVRQGICPKACLEQA